MGGAQLAGSRDGTAAARLIPQGKSAGGNNQLPARIFPDDGHNYPIIRITPSRDHKHESR
jgi:hypothetical protein